MNRCTTSHSVRKPLQYLLSLIIAFLAADCHSTSNNESPIAANIGEATAKPWPQRDLSFAECMVVAAGETHLPLDETPPFVCDALLTEPFEHMTEYSTDVLRIFKRQFDIDNQAHLEIIVAFTGTRISNIGDIARDIESQFPSRYNNELIIEHPNAIALSGDEKVSRGFDRRWENHASIVKGALRRFESNANASGRDVAMSIMVVGHSLGAAIAARAAFDLNRSIQHKRITLWSFNTPRIGNTAFAQAYAKSIKTCTFQDSGCFMVRTFTRSGDPVHKLPLLMQHPIWNPDLDEDTRKSTGNVTQQALDYCPHYHAPKQYFFKLTQNHQLELWREDLYAIPPGHLTCMFGEN